MARRVAMPDAVSRLVRLDRVDYDEAFAAAVPRLALASSSPERLLQNTTARAPRWLMHVLVPALHRRILRLRLDRAGPALGPPGWHRIDSLPDAAVIGAHGPLFTFRLVLAKSPDDLLLATFIRYEHPAARPIWAVVKFGHRAATRYLLDLGARLAATGTAAQPARSTR